MGGLRLWKDGRDAPDVTLGLFNYPETERHPSFTVALQSNFAHGGGLVTGMVMGYAPKLWRDLRRK